MPIAPSTDTQHLRPFVHSTGHQELIGGSPLKLDALLGVGPLGRREVSARGLLVTTRELEHFGQSRLMAARFGRRRRCLGLLEADAKEARGLIEGELGGCLLTCDLREARSSLAVSSSQPVHRKGLGIGVGRGLECLREVGVMLADERRREA